MNRNAPPAGTGQIKYKNDWQNRGGRPVASRTAKLQSVARPKAFIPTEIQAKKGDNK